MDFKCHFKCIKELFVTPMKLSLSFEFNFFCQTCVLLCPENTEALIEQFIEKRQKTIRLEYSILIETFKKINRLFMRIRFNTINENLPAF